jgi:hypothetical protein
MSNGRYRSARQRIKLNPCPSCKFNARDDYEKKFLPILYKSEFISKGWVVDCPNCGAEFLFHQETAERTALMWNALPR